MSAFALTLREKIPSDVFTDSEVTSLLQGTADRRYALVKRALASGDLIQIRRGVYSLGKKYQRQPLNLFELAQKVYAPSYVSQESALSYHGWIPEAAYTVSSVSLKRSTSFDTPLGLFSYTRLPRFNFVGVERVTAGTSIFLIATPTKALTDYVLAQKLDVRDPVKLLESLRVERECLQEISLPLLNEVVNAYGSRRAVAFARAMKGLT